ncbi:MAG TPA: FG-GAP-like repeat-containing protein [Bryobacteraceae bacterium]|nr:FG-GAP-like repeat-containing protein [Bryobacteraceae bacterium]
MLSRKYWITLSSLAMGFVSVYGQLPPKPSYGFVAAAQPSSLFSRYTALSDIDGDGKSDIVTADGAGIVVTLGNGDGTYRPSIHTPLSDMVSAFAIADIDGDGCQDLIVYGGAAFSTQSLTVLLGLGDGSFRLAGKMTLSGAAFNPNVAGANPIVLADFDRNGLLDIATFNGHVSLNGVLTDTVSVRLNQGNGTFGSPVTFSTGPWSGAPSSIIAAGDFNRDGNPDVAEASAYGGMSVILGTGTGSFGSPLTFSANLDPGTQITNLAVADLNGDGSDDLVTAQSWNFVPAEASVAVYLSRADGTFAPRVAYRPSVIDIYETTSVNAGAVLLADLTGDGKLDLVTSNYRPTGFGEIAVYPGNGDGTFQPASVYQTSAQAYLLAAADLNSDGRIDLVVSSPSTTTQLVAVQILNGASAPYLRVQITHDGPTYLDQQAQFNVQVVNLGDAPTSGNVVVTPGLEAPVAGWNCSYVDVNSYYTLQCSRSDSLAPGESFPAIPMTLGKPDPNVSGNNPTLVATVSGGGSARSNGQDTAAVIRLNSQCPFLFGTSATDGVVLKQTVLSRLGGSFTLSVGSDPGCPWTANTNTDWLTAPSPSNTTYTVAPNPSGVTRTATLSFSSITGWSDSLTIVQSGKSCLYDIEPKDYTFSAQGGSTLYFVTVESGCPINPSVSANWVSLTTVGSGFIVDTAPNTTSNMRQATITVGDASIRVFQLSPNQVSLHSGFMAHFAVGGGWETTLQIVNASDVAARAGLATLGTTGSLSGIPAYVDDEMFYTSTYLYSLNRVLQPHAMVGIYSAEPGSVATIVGSLNLQFDSGIGGFERFRYVPTGQEALVSMETRVAKSFTLGFDNTGGNATGIALVAEGYDMVPVSVVTVTATIRDDAGNLIDSATSSMNLGSHDSFVLSDRFPRAAGKSGTIQFSSGAPAQISVLGVRFPPSNRFSIIPPASEIDPGSGTMPELAVGGGWSTAVEVINTTAAPAPALLSFSASDGSALTLPLSYAGTTTQASQLQQTVAPNARLLVTIAGANNGPVQTGSAHLVSSTGVSGFIRYSYPPAGQDAIVPLETRQAASYVFPFDNTGGAGTGVAVANSSAAAATIPVIIYDATGTQIASDTVTLPAHGQTAFVLANRIPATVNSKGLARFKTPTFGAISVLGVRSPSSGAFTTIPVMTE